MIGIRIRFRLNADSITAAPQASGAKISKKAPAPPNTSAQKQISSNGHRIESIAKVECVRFAAGCGVS
jgi:hypothetical protein